MARKRAIVKYFKKGDTNIREVFKNFSVDEKSASMIETYKAYYLPKNTPRKLIGFDRDGKIVYLENSHSFFKEQAPSMPHSVYIYRKRTKTDKIDLSKNYNFIVCNKNGQVTEHESREGLRTYIYDSNDHLIKEINDGLVSCEYEYDKKGRKISETAYDMDDGSIESVKKYHYDGKSRLIKEETFKTGLRKQYLQYYLCYHYDKKGNLIKKEEFRGNGTLGSFEEHKYSSGKKVKQRDYFVLKSGPKEKNSIEFFYKDNLLYREGIYRKDELYMKIFYTYDSFGRLIKEERFNNNLELDFSSIRQYDDRKIRMDKNTLETLLYFQNDGYDLLVNNNRVLKEKTFCRFYTNNSVIKSRATHKYDKQGRLSERTFIESMEPDGV